MFSYTLFAEARDYKINVIRPRYFVKKNRLELAADAQMVMNETFTYTLLFSAMSAFHFTEYLAVGFDAAVGLNIDKPDTKTLKEDFYIEISSTYTKYNFGGNIMWSPVYGKYQLSSGKLIYFDTYVIGGGGLSTINMKIPSDGAEEGTEERINCLAGSIGVGQRFYLNKHVSLRWQVKDVVIHIDQSDRSCTPNQSNTTQEPERYLYNTIIFQAGASYFI